MNCPACGAAPRYHVAGVCRSCGQPIETEASDVVETVKRCGDCRGYGRVSYDQHDDGQPIIEDCRACEGTGTISL